MLHVFCIGDFVKTHNLQEGDFLMLYKDDQAGKYVSSEYFH